MSLVFPLIQKEDFPGKFEEGVPNETYHADKSFISSSGLKTITEESCWHFYNKYILGENEEPTAAMKWGNIVHTALLEPGKFRERYKVVPNFGPLQSSKNREAKALWIAEQPPGTILVTEEELEMLTTMIQSVQRHEVAANLLSTGVPEISGYCKDEETEVLCKIRPDFLKFDNLTLIDYKTTQNASALDFQRSIMNYRYDLQLAFYYDKIKQITGQAPEAAIWIAQEKTKPYAVAVYVADETILDHGRNGGDKFKGYRQALRDYRVCVEKDWWPDYQNGMAQQIFLPDWVF